MGFFAWGSSVGLDVTHDSNGSNGLNDSHGLRDSHDRMHHTGKYILKCDVIVYGLYGPFHK